MRSRIREFLPEGIPLAQDQWDRRHRAILVILWAHVAGLTAMAFLRGYEPQHALFEGSLVAVLAGIGTQSAVGGRRLRAVATAAGLVVSSAVLVHLSGGVVEMHFHFFVVVGIITLYQDWTVFLAAILFVAAHHGVLGALRPMDVYNHSSAWNNPWKWAAIHAGFVLAASAAQVTSWRFAEDQFRRAERDLLARDRRYRSLIENGTDGIAVISQEGTVVYVSPTVASILGYDPAERVGLSMLEPVHPDDLALAAETFERVAKSNLRGGVSVELRARHADGTWRILEVRFSDLLDNPDVAGIVANFRDVSERKDLEVKLAHRAFHDSLTELPNRALFLDRIAHAVATQRRTGEPLAVLFIDLDDFKTVNDGLGHAAGDHVLQEVGRRLRSCLRDADTCARLGGDEFGVLLEGLASPGEAYEVGARILEVLADDYAIKEGLSTLNASLGIVVSSEPVEPDVLVRNADLAMYRAKSEGKGRYSIFETGMHDAVVERLAMKADLRRAVEQNEFIVYFQPILDLPTGRAVGAEALVRWDHPERGVLAPAAFLELAEETGLIAEIGASVLWQACRDAAEWNRIGDRLIGVSVNLSACQLRTELIVEQVAMVLAETGLRVDALTLEITESLLMEDPDRAASVLQRLKALGVHVALDDFGTGYSSLSYLSRFPVDILKIDKSFVDTLAGGSAENEVALVRAIVGLGGMLDLKVTAEGIEGRDQMAALRALGCDFGQGYLFSKPVPNAAFAGLLDTEFATAVADVVPASWTEDSTSGA